VYTGAGTDGVRVGEAGLWRETDVLAGAAVATHATVGTGIFKKPAEVARQAGSREAVLLVWTVGAATALAGTLRFPELAAAMPRTGAFYEYLRRAWGPRTPFLYGGGGAEELDAVG
jgi:amino acid transporter